MSFEREISELEAEWAPEDGFFWRLREAQFERTAFERTLAKMARVHIEDHACVPIRLVSVLWYIPIFMHWQTDRLIAAGRDGDEYTQAIVLVTNELERLLGVP
jgi:hypothetical protein